MSKTKAAKRNQTRNQETTKTKNLPNLRQRNVIAVACSDIHFSDKPPLARTEADWFETMGRAFGQVRYTCDFYNAPLFIAGDIFDHWKVSPALVNWTINQLRRILRVYAVPGQHDLPYHNYADVEQSSYHTLELAGVIRTLDTLCHRGRTFYGLPWAQQIPKAKMGAKNILIAHAYIWRSGKNHPGVKESDHIGNWEALLEEKNFTCAAFGDNHRGFLNSKKNILNCGTLMRRKSDEIDYEPQIGLLLDSGIWETVKLSTGNDKFVELEGPLLALEQSLDISDFLAELRELSDSSLNFETTVTDYLRTNKVPPTVQKIVLSAMKGKR